MRTTPPPPPSTRPPTAPAASSIAVDVFALEGLLHHAAFAAHLVGHLDDDKQTDLIGQIADRVDTVVHSLSELLGKARTLAEHDAAAPDVAHDGAPVLASSAGGAP